MFLINFLFIYYFKKFYLKSNHITTNLLQKQEFENESGLPDSAPSTTSLQQQPPEFPIFRALSTTTSSSSSSSSPQPQLLLPPSQHNNIYNKNDNFIGKTNQQQQQQHTLSNERLPVINVTSIPIQVSKILIISIYDFKYIYNVKMHNTKYVYG